MHRLGVYRIRLPKNYICKPPRYTTLVWRETEGDGEGDGDITRLVPKDADTSGVGVFTFWHFGTC